MRRSIPLVLIALLAATPAKASTTGPEGPMRTVDLSATSGAAPRADIPYGPGTAPFCDGDGVSGQRVQAAYGHIAGTPDNYAATVSVIRTMAAEIDGAYDLSAGLEGGSAHPHWAFKPGTCDLSVLKIELPADAANNLDSTVATMRSMRLLARQDRKYIVWIDAEGTANLISTLRPDDNPDPAANRSNGGKAGGEATISQIDRNAWDTDGLNGPVVSWGMQHELSHQLGAVNASAPHSDGTGHCTDEYDAMCMGDANAPVCGDTSFASFSRYKQLLDCNHDDYFAVHPPAGSYLATHWNTYNSSFLVRTDTADSPPETLEITGPSRTRSRRPSFRFSSNDTGAKFRCKLDKRGFRPCAKRYRTPPLKPGRHTLLAQAVDAAGNLDWTPTEKRFRVQR